MIDRNEYTYLNYQGTCRGDDYDKIFYLDTPAYVDVAADMSSFKAALRLGPVSVAFGASDAFMYYESGIYDGDCAYDVNHGMAAIGYGSENGVEFVLVRNSWGTYWGEDGYVRIKMGSDDPSGGLCQVY